MSFSSRRLLAAAALVSVVVAGVVLLGTGPSGKASFESPTLVHDEGQIERGRYLALAGNCTACHTTPSGEYMAGGVPFETPFGRIYSTNITPDAATGIGGWSADDFLTSMRHGLRPDGEHLYPVFPYTAFTKILDEDVAALYAYFRSIPAVTQENLENDLAFPFNLRALMSVWKAMYFDAGPMTKSVAESDQWHRGAYLVEAFAHCGACHSPRNFLGATKTDLEMTGGRYIDEVKSGAWRPWFAPNLTSAPSGLGIWPEEEVAAYLKTGRNSFVETFGPMNEVIMHSTRHLDDDDINAMAAYLKSLPAVEDETGPEADRRVLGMGRTVYNLHCGTCHLPTGLGDPEMAPRLGGGSLVVRASDPASLINVILYGPEPPDPPLPEKWLKPMEEFRYLLDDDEVAALASFVRHSWGNTGGAVTAEQVEAQR